MRLRARLRMHDSSMPLPPARTGTNASPTRGPPQPTRTARTMCSTRARLTCLAPSRLSSRPSLTTAWSHSRRRCILRERTRKALQFSRPSPTSASRVRPAQSRSSPTAIGSPRPSATLSTCGATAARSSRPPASAALTCRPAIPARTTPSHGPRTNTLRLTLSAPPKTTSTPSSSSLRLLHPVLR